MSISYSPSQSAAEDESSTSQPTPTKSVTVIGKELAKKRLRAFQLSKQANLSAGTSKSLTRLNDSVTETTLDDDSPSTTSSTAPSDEIKKKKTKGRVFIQCVGACCVLGVSIAILKFSITTF